MKSLTDVLSGSLTRLHPRDQAFAKSLVEQSKTRQLSEKQLFWVERLIEMANDKTPTVEVSDSGGVVGIIELINRNNNAKFPAIRFLAGEKEMKITKAGPTARFPNTLNVIVLTKETRDWCGRIHLDGRFEPKRTMSNEQKTLVLKALRKLVKNPEAAAYEYGKKTGHCCFCGLRLNDERSLLMGYGPICADNYKLAWGERPKDESEET